MESPKDTQEYVTPINESALKRPGLLALAIVQAADGSIPIRDYVKELQSHLIQKNRETTGCTAECVDACSYWKKKFVESEIIQVSLRDRIHELEVRNRTIIQQEKNNPPRSSQLPSSQDVVMEGDDPDRTDQGKRKTSRPRVRGVKDISINCSTLDMAQEELELFTSPSTPSSLLRLLYNVRQSVRQRRPDITAFSNTLISLIAVIQEVIQTISKSTVAWRYSSSANPELLSSKINSIRPTQTETMFLVISRTISYLFKGFEKLCKADSENRAIGRITYQLITLFDTILDQIENISIAESKVKSNLLKQAGDKPSLQNKRSYETSADLDIRAAMCRILVGLIKVLNVDLSAKDDLLEGYLCTFLKHLAYTINAAVFQVSRECSDMSQEIATSGLSERQKQKTSALRYLAPYMAWLTKQIEPELHSFSSRSNKTSAEVDLRMTETPFSVKRSLYQQANQKIQHTLLQGIFEDDQNSFFETFEIPTYDSESPITSTIDTTSSKEPTEAFVRYIEEIWRLVGWETLGLQDDEGYD